MKVLMIDTTAAACSAAIADDGKVIIEQFLNDKLTHSVNLMRLIDNCFCLSGISVDEIDAYAVCTGPGSFTGLRIGICAIKGFAQVKGKPCYAVSSLDALSKNADKDGTVVSIMDARHEQVYAAAYRDSKKIIEDTALPIIELLDMLEPGALFLGDGAIAYRELILKNYPSARFCDDNACFIHAGAMAEIVFSKDAKTLNAEELKPEYLRKAQAERLREEAK